MVFGRAVKFLSMGLLDPTLVRGGDCGIAARSYVMEKTLIATVI